MKTILVFKQDEQEELDLALNGHKAASALDDLDGQLRKVTKYGERLLSPEDLKSEEHYTLQSMDMERCVLAAESIGLVAEIEYMVADKIRKMLWKAKNGEL